MEIGRKSVCSRGAEFFGTGRTRMEAHFHGRGTTEVDMDLLNRRAMGLQKTGAPNRRNQAGKLPKPRAVLGSLWRILNTSHSVITSIRRQAAVCYRCGGWWPASVEMRAYCWFSDTADIPSTTSTVCLRPVNSSTAAHMSLLQVLGLMRLRRTLLWLAMSLPICNANASAFSNRPERLRRFLRRGLGFIPGVMKCGSLEVVITVRCG